MAALATCAHARGKRMRILIRLTTCVLIVSLASQSCAWAGVVPRPRRSHPAPRHVRVRKTGIPKAASETHPSRDALSPFESLFYSREFVNAAKLLLPLKDKHDNSYALWCNQLGSVYLAAQDTGAALEQFSEAFLVMNSIDAFRHLEKKALSLRGEESAKGYKGDPYEKVYNALYLALLLYGAHDSENALAALRNGILCDSDVEAQAYKSDATLLYLLAARIEKERGNPSMAQEFFGQAVLAYYLSHPLNRDIVWEEQGARSALAAAEKELAKRQDARRDKNGVVRENDAIRNLKKEVGRLDDRIRQLVRQREAQSRGIDTAALDGVIEPQQNVLLVVEMGRSPSKEGAGRYGEKVVFSEAPYAAKNIRVTQDLFFTVPDPAVLKYNDVYYQASTRGGRKMDSILAGKAQFKQSAAEASDLLVNYGIIAATEASDMDSDKRDKAYGVAGFLFLAGIASSVFSSVTKPAADLRHWSLLPAEVQVVPMKLAAGQHRLIVRVYDDRWQPLSGLDREVDVTVEPGRPTVVFTRIFE